MPRTTGATPRLDPIRTNIPARLDGLPWSRPHWLVVIALGASWAIDGLEVAFTGAISGTLQDSATLHLTSPGTGALASSYLFGGVAGALVCGCLTDRHGRQAARTREAEKILFRHARDLSRRYAGERLLVGRVDVRVLAPVGGVSADGAFATLQPWLADLQTSLGPFPMPRGLSVVLTQSGGGTEYYGATTASLRALRHEVFHMYFACSIGRVDNPRLVVGRSDRQGTRPPPG
jgi:MFS family permease